MVNDDIFERTWAKQVKKGIRESLGEESSSKTRLSDKKTASIDLGPR